MGTKLKREKERAYFCPIDNRKFPATARELLTPGDWSLAVCPRCGTPCEPFSKMRNRRTDVTEPCSDCKGQGCARCKKTGFVTLHFQAEGEAKRWGDLRLAEHGGAIKNLKRQVPYAIRIPDVNGKLVVIFSYVADFVYVDTVTRREYVEDWKGRRTQDYRMKKKAMKIQYGIEILETGPEERVRRR